MLSYPGILLEVRQEKIMVVHSKLILSKCRGNNLNLKYSLLFLNYIILVLSWCQHI